MKLMAVQLVNKITNFLKYFCRIIPILSGLAAQFRVKRKYGLVCTPTVRTLIKGSNCVSLLSNPMPIRKFHFSGQYANLFSRPHVSFNGRKYPNLINLFILLCANVGRIYGQPVASEIYCGNKAGIRHPVNRKNEHFAYLA